MTFAPLPPRALLLRVLNRDGMFVESVVVPEYIPGTVWSRAEETGS